MAGFQNNRHYNDPALGAAFSNLASMFAPPSAQDTAAYAAAASKRAEENRIAQLFASTADPSAQAALIGLQTYGQTPAGFTYKTDQDNATQRYGYDQSAAAARYGHDTSAATTLEKAAMDNQADVVTGLFAPLGEGEVRPAVPADIAGIFALPEVDMAAGAPPRMSETEAKAAERMRLAREGTLTDDMLLDAIIGERTPVEAVGPGGQPVYMSPGAAARQGAEAYVEPEAAKPRQQVWLRDDATGETRRGFYDPATGQTLLEDGTAAPANFMPYDLPKTEGTPDQTGIGVSTRNQVEKQVIELQTARDTATRLRDLVASSPASQGIVGRLRGTAQNVIQTGGELGEFFGGGVAEVTAAIEAGAADANLAGAFDANIPAIDMLGNLLAFQYAKTTTGERLSNEMLQQTKKALGLDRLTANQADALVRLDEAIGAMDRQRDTLLGVRANGLDGAPAQPAAQGPSVGEVIDGHRFIGGDPADQNNWEPI